MFALSIGREDREEVVAMQVLVAYGSKRGGTAEVAEMIGEEMERRVQSSP